MAATAVGRWAMQQDRRDLDWLDEAFRESQDDLEAAIARGDAEAIGDARAMAGALHVTDAEGFQWRVHAPQGARGAKPYFRFHYRYWGSPAGGELRPTTRSRFAGRPSLAKTYAAALGTKGWLSTVVRNVEPIGYVAAAAVGLGLWFLLGDVVGSLPGSVILVSMVVLAAGLWVSTVRLEEVPYREAERLGHVTRAAAVGVTGAVPWLAMMDASWIDDVGRTAVTASVLTIASGLSYARTRSPFTYSIGLGSLIVGLGAISAVAFSDVLGRTAEWFAAQPGILLGIALAFPLGTWLGVKRWIPQTVIVLSSIGAITIMTALEVDLNTWEASRAVGFGILATAAAWLSRRHLRPALRRFHLWGSVALGLSTGLVALTHAPWDFVDTILEWLSDVPLPVLMIVAGSIGLIAVTWIIRTAVARMADRDADEIDREGGSPDLTV
ncbi:MAG: hypothetical protein DWP92_06310 [Armatimonadetes bacterium]|nr:MAG: hypothetical protein DWP92_06310 [Armatimonadota bacterium]